MVTTRTHTQTAFDGVRSAWHVYSVPDISPSIVLPLSIDGVRWDRSRVSTRMVSASVVERREATPSLAGAFGQLIRSMDGVRLQPRMQ